VDSPIVAAARGRKVAHTPDLAPRADASVPEAAFGPLHAEVHMLRATEGGPPSSPIADHPGLGSRGIREPAIRLGPDIEVAPLAYRHVRIHGPSGLLHVWLGGASDPVALEADVRAVSDEGQPRAAAAVAFGEIARRHGIEVRVIPRAEAGVHFLLVLFGGRTPRFRR
jgi:hypothetical protein